MFVSRDVRRAGAAFLGVVVMSSAVAVAGTAIDEVDLVVFLQDMNAASDGSVNLVIMACKLFVPDVLEVRSGQTIHFLWDDPCQEAAHTVTSSGSTFDPAQDLDKPQPPYPANCFDSSLEPNGGPIIGPGRPDYFVTLIYQGVVLRDLDESLEYQEVPPYIPPSDTQPACVTDASFIVPDDLTATQDYRAIVPYFCRLHGRIEDPPGGGMRGAIILAP